MITVSFRHLTAALGRHRWAIAYFISCGVLFLAEMALIGQKFPGPVPLYSTLDFSWMTDLLERWSHGFIAGRDFIFTYGPLFQIIYALPMTIFGVTSYQSMMYEPAISLLFTAILTYVLTGRIFKDPQVRTIHSLILLLLVGLAVIPSAGALRFLPMVTYAAVLGGSINRKPIGWTTSLWLSAVPSLFGLYAFDLFVYCALVSLAGAVLAVLANKHALRPTFNFLGLVGLWQIATSLLLSGSLDYTRYSLDVVRVYQYVMNIDWVFPSKMPFASLIILAISLGLLLKEKGWSRHPAAVMVSLAAIVYWKSALTRADDSHLLLGMYPTLVASYLNVWILAKKYRSALLMLPFLFVLTPFHANYSYLVPSRVINGFRSLTQKSDFFSLYSIVTSRYSFTGEELALIKRYILTNPGEVLIYPYDSFLLNAQGQTYNTYILQWYQTAGSILEQEAVRRLAINPPKIIIFPIDNATTSPLDGIPNPTRNPIFFDWVRQNYRVAENGERLIILEYDPHKLWTTSPDCLVWQITFDPKPNLANKIVGLLKPPTYWYHNGDVLFRLPVLPRRTSLKIYQQSDSRAGLIRLFTMQSGSVELKVEQPVTISAYYALIKRSVTYHGQDVVINCSP